MSEHEKGNPNDQLFADIKKFTSGINCVELENKGFFLSEEFYRLARRASELMREMIPDRQLLGEPTRQAFKKFLEEPTLKRLELCFSEGAIKGIFRLHTLKDAELRRLLIRMSKIHSDVKKIQAMITRFEEYVMEIKKIR